ncbi:DUF1410 domain-containing protein [Ureaplasma parvum]|uniref:DUF1410 domain-containing protein n=2 Tax=Ureaplasma parvum TaxID=134821 RepID=UPI00017220DA|nr:DUF1410 domain-containing protein [Ureaplasma parvum]ASD24752.1 hypothetical protein CEG38_02540 [Ureaplasma parvum]EDT49055.1 putative lipoprotein [Ureaplasma parvum serovar 1 str. ATCC 27813]UIU28434.1 DUF1410 domain-containing protein [Ureaplasma parvum]BBD81671.1 membrane protein [Ureaplasma parvum serovar 3]
MITKKHLTKIIAILTCSTLIIGLSCLIGACTKSKSKVNDKQVLFKIKKFKTTTNSIELFLEGSAVLASHSYSVVLKEKASGDLKTINNLKLVKDNDLNKLIINGLKPNMGYELVDLLINNQKQLITKLDFITSTLTQENVDQFSIKKIDWKNITNNSADLNLEFAKYFLANENKNIFEISLLNLQTQQITKFKFNYQPNSPSITFNFTQLENHAKYQIHKIVLNNKELVFSNQNLVLSNTNKQNPNTIIKDLSIAKIEKEIYDTSAKLTFYFKDDKLGDLNNQKFILKLVSAHQPSNTLSFENYVYNNSKKTLSFTLTGLQTNTKYSLNSLTLNGQPISLVNLDLNILTSTKLTTVQRLENLKHESSDFWFNDENLSVKIKLYFENNVNYLKNKYLKLVYMDNANNSIVSKPVLFDPTKKEYEFSFDKVLLNRKYTFSKLVFDDLQDFSEKQALEVNTQGLNNSFNTPQAKIKIKKISYSSTDKSAKLEFHLEDDFDLVDGDKVSVKYKLKPSSNSINTTNNIVEGLVHNHILNVTINNLESNKSYEVIDFIINDYKNKQLLNKPEFFKNNTNHHNHPFNIPLDFDTKNSDYKTKFNVNEISKSYNKETKLTTIKLKFDNIPTNPTSSNNFTFTIKKRTGYTTNPISPKTLEYDANKKTLIAKFENIEDQIVYDFADVKANNQNIEFNKSLDKYFSIIHSADYHE